VKQLKQFELLKMMEDKETDKLVKELEALMSEGVELYMGRALYYMYEVGEKEEYLETISALANKAKDYEITDIKDMYTVQPFYMQYDTNKGGKGHYAEIIAKINGVDKAFYNDSLELEDLEWYLLGLIDTLAVTSEQIFEYYMTIIQLFKKAFKQWCSRNVEPSEVMQYVIDKACDMKVILREKYQKGC